MHHGPRDNMDAYDSVEMIDKQDIGTDDGINNGVRLDEDKGPGVGIGVGLELAEGAGVGTGNG